MSRHHRRASWLSALRLATANLLTATSGAVAHPPTVDSVQITGPAPGFPNIGVNAEQSGAGLYATGQAFLQPGVGAIMTGRVSYLRVTGPDRGAGTPRRADDGGRGVFFDIRFGPVTVKVVDNGGTATNSDTNQLTRAVGPGCFAENPDLPPLVPVHGFVVVFDAPPPAPTSKEQCKNGGWQAFGALFKKRGTVRGLRPARPPNGSPRRLAGASARLTPTAGVTPCTVRIA